MEHLNPQSVGNYSDLQSTAITLDKLQTLNTEQLTKRGYLSTYDFREQLLNKGITKEDIKRYSIVLDNLCIYPLSREEDIDLQPILKNYPRLFRPSPHYISYKERETIVFNNWVKHIAKELNEGIIILPNEERVNRLSPIFGYSVYISTIPKKVTFKKAITTILPPKEERAHINVKLNQASKELNREEEDEQGNRVIISQSLGALYPMHEAYLQPSKRGVSIEDNPIPKGDSKEEWNTYLMREGLGTHFESIVAVQTFDKEECSTFNPTINQDGTEITREQREEYMKDISRKRRVSKKNTIRKQQATKRKAKKLAIKQEAHRIGKSTKYIRRERAIPPSKR